jgi:hypothetical protein
MTAMPNPIAIWRANMGASARLIVAYGECLVSATCD